MPANTPMTRRQMGRPTLMLARITSPLARAWRATSTIVVTAAWIASLAPMWAPLCAYPTDQQAGMIAGSATALTVAAAASHYPTRTPAWRTIVWAWFASILTGLAIQLPTLTHMFTWASWPTLGAVAAAFLVTAARTHSTARTVFRLARELRWLR